MFFSFSHFQAGWNQSIETKLRYSGAQKNIFYIPLLLVLRGGEVMAVVIPVGRYVPQIGLRAATRTYNRGQKLQTENLDPAHHQIKDGKIFLAFVWLYPWLRNEVMGVGFSVPFFSVQDCSWMFLSSGILILWPMLCIFVSKLPCDHWSWNTHTVDKKNFQGISLYSYWRADVES